MAIFGYTNYDYNYMWKWWFWLGLIIGSVIPDSDIEYGPASILPLWIFIKHRTWTHSMWTPLILAIVTQYNYFLGLGLILGSVSHIIADCTTHMGCPLFYPFIKSRFSAGFFSVKQSDSGVKAFAFLTIIYQILK